MNELLKYAGVLVLLLGVVTLAIHFILGTQENWILFVGLLLIIGGYLSHIFINKKLTD